MDHAVAFVEAYLYINGYFTVTEYPVIETLHHNKYRVATDLDILGIRFPGAGRFIPGAKSSKDIFSIDPKLGCPSDKADMLVGEVKEGHAELNRSVRNPDVLRVMLARFGCCSLNESESVVDELVRKGYTTTPMGHRVRLVAFGMAPENMSAPDFHIISMEHVVQFLEGYLHEHWAVLRTAQFKHPAFGLLALLEKVSQRKRKNSFEAKTNA